MLFFSESSIESFWPTKRATEGRAFSVSATSFSFCRSKSSRARARSLAKWSSYLPSGRPAMFVVERSVCDADERPVTASCDLYDRHRSTVLTLGLTSLSAVLTQTDSWEDGVRAGRTTTRQKACEGTCFFTCTCDSLKYPPGRPASFLRYRQRNRKPPLRSSADTQHAASTRSYTSPNYRSGFLSIVSPNISPSSSPSSCSAWCDSSRVLLISAGGRSGPDNDTTAKISASQQEGPSIALEDRVGAETRNSREHCPPTNDRQLRWSQACHGSPGPRTEHAEQREEREKVQPC